MILHRTQWQKLNQILESQQTPHISPLRASYGVSIVRILEKIDRVIIGTALYHAIYVSLLYSIYHRTQDHPGIMYKLTDWVGLMDYPVILKDVIKIG